MAILIKFLMTETFINKEYLEQDAIRDLSIKYQNAKPFPHIEISNFFKKDIIQDINLNFPNLQKINSYKRDSKNEIKFGLEDQSKIPKNISDFIMFLNSQNFLRLLQEITSIEELLISDPYLLGGGLHETKKGGFLKVHSDFYTHQKFKLDRRLNLLIYLNDDWKYEYGGHLELWDKYMKNCVKKVEIGFNKLCIFSTDNFSFHGYPDPIDCPENKSRKSLALYYYSNGRPDKESMKSMPNTTNWKNRLNKREVANNYSIKDYLRKITLLRKIKKFISK
tara:strand:- start:448 stop:1284 length:837 start_codon:yes stop_codon:yes gene_type:complete